MTLFVSTAFALLFGMLFTRVTKIFKLPDVTAYLVSGLLIGPYFLGRLGVEGVGFTSFEILENLKFISDAALGFIAFAIGNEFRLSSLKSTGKQAVIIGILQAIVTTIVVDICLFLLHLAMPDKLSIPAVITLGAIATATAPAATLMVVKQYKAKGKVTDLLLPVVALDDAVGLAVFAVSFGIARAVAGGEVSMASIIFEPIIEIVASLLLGGVLGLLLALIEKVFNSNRKRLSIIVAFILATVGLSMLSFEVGGIHIGFSSLLVCMMLGTVFCNRSILSEDLMDKSDRWAAPLLALFFILSGAELELSVFSNIAVVIVGVVYILSRCVGKYFGAYFSCIISKTDETVRKYLGITLFPQAGVALGMCVTAMTLGEDGIIVRNIILFGVLIYELFGPMFTKMALTKSGDIVPPSDEVINRRANAIAKKKAAQSAHQHK